MKFRFIDDMLNRSIRECVDNFMFEGKELHLIELPFSSEDIQREDFYSVVKKYKTLDFNLEGFYDGKRTTVLSFSIFNKSEYININNLCERVFENE